MEECEHCGAELEDYDEECCPVCGEVLHDNEEGELWGT